MQTLLSIYEAFVEIWPVILAIDLIRYLAAAGALAAVLWVFSNALSHRRIQDVFAEYSDIRREILYSLSTVLVFSLVGLGVYVGSKHGLFRVYGGDLPGAGRLLAEFALIVLAHDAYFYWAHRLMHHRRLFRLFHRVHHKSRTPTPWAAYAFAPLEAIVEAGILPLAALLLPMHELTVFLFVTHMIARNVIGHAGIELFPRWWLSIPLLRAITTTTHHDLHHSHGRSNYGLYFTWWDRWFGTEHPQYERRFDEVTQRRLASDLLAQEKS